MRDFGVKLMSRVIHCSGNKQGHGNTWDFPKIRVPYFGVPIIRILLFRVLC